MTTITVEDAQANLADILKGLKPGEELVIVDDARPVARLVGVRPAPRPGPGLCRGMLTVVADDDEHLNDFAEYLP